MTPNSPGDKNSFSIDKLQKIVGHGFDNAAKGFSSMTGQMIHVVSPLVRFIPLQDVSMTLGGPETDAVGIYLRIEGDISGQVMLILPYEKALEMADLLLELPFGTTQTLGTLERSALAEIGNLTGTFFLNAVSELTGIGSRPTPPAVMVDMVGSIIDVIIATMGRVEKDVLMFQSKFMLGERETNANFWIIPDPGTLEKIASAGKLDD
jgi:chemotaxis protein CheC